jgi:hypothetical protein
VLRDRDERVFDLRFAACDLAWLHDEDSVISVEIHQCVEVFFGDCFVRLFDES